MEILLLRLGDLKIFLYFMFYYVVKFDFFLEVVEWEEDIGLSFDYVVVLFKDEMIWCWSSYFVNIIKEVVINLNVWLFDVDLFLLVEIVVLFEESYMI